MSTKTTFKRVAAVAAAALAIGGLSAVSANAAADYTLVPSTTASAQSVNATVGTYKIVEIQANTADKYYTITNAGGTVFYPSSTPDTTTALSASDASTELWYSGATPGAAVFGSSKVLDFSIYSAAAGTQTITIKGDVNTAAQTIVVTWGAAATFSATNSTAVIVDTSTAGVSAADIQTYGIANTSNATIVKAKTLNKVATIYVHVLNNTGAGAAITSGKLSATVTGSGLLTGRASGTAAMDGAGLVTRAATSYQDAQGWAAFDVWGDNTSGTGTIAISYTSAGGTTTALATKTVTFTGTTPATMTTTQSGNVAAPGAVLGTADTLAGDGAITATLLDSNGNPVASLTGAGSAVSPGWYLVSDNTACITTTLAGGAGSVSDGSVTSADGIHNLLGTYNLVVTAAGGATSGCSANVTAHYYVSSSLDVAGTPIKFTVGLAKISSITLTTDADTYAPGDKVTATLTAKDSSGNPVADGYYGIFYDAAAAALAAGSTVTPVTLSAQTTNIPFSITGATGGSDKSYWIQAGVATSKFYAPYTDGTVTMSATLASSNAGAVPSKIASALYASSLKGSFTVANPTSAASQAAIDAAQEATDAANAAYDAANNAMDSADAATAAAQDASDNASAALAAVTSLSATVAKLVKSVAAIAAALAKVQKKIGA